MLWKITIVTLVFLVQPVTAQEKPEQSARFS